MTLKPDICVIGAGSAGLTVAAAAANFGHDVVLVERGRMGGDCLNYGCVPSKSLIAAARHAHMAADGARFGVNATPRIDYGAVHRHIHDVIGAIAPHDSVERFEGLGVHVIKADARFRDERTLEAGGEPIEARRFVIATGSRPMVPDIEGLAAVEPLTNESVFDLTALPASIAIIGGGPIGAELGQAFARLGSTVTIATSGDFLAKEDPDAAAVVRAAMERDGVIVIDHAKVECVSGSPSGATLHLAGGRTVEAERVLMATGRAPNIESLDLRAAGVETHPGGIAVNKGMRTANRRIYAIGDVTGGPQFTHVAGHQGSLAVRAIVFRLPVSFDAEAMPRCTYTAPELAQVGLTEAEAMARWPGATAWKAPLSGNDRAQADGETEGFVKLVLDGKGKLAGATIVAPHAGEMIATYTLALAGKVSLQTIAGLVLPYPTLGEAGKRAAVNHFGERLDKPWLKRALSLLKRFP